MRPKSFNDLFALVLTGLILGIWLSRANLPADVNGALVVVFTLIVQYYFRKAPPA